MREISVIPEGDFNTATRFMCKHNLALINVMDHVWEFANRDGPPQALYETPAIAERRLFG